MLSFSSYSELPLASAISSAVASAYLPTTFANSSVGTLLYEAKANKTVPFVSASFVAAPFSDLDAKASTDPITSVSAITYSGTSISKGSGTTSLTGVYAVPSTGLQTATGLANTISAQASATFNAGYLDFDARANTTLNSVTAITQYISSFADEDAQATASVSGVEATTTADWDTVNGIYAVNVIYLNTDFERKRTVNIVPYGNYTVYVTR